ncbi:MAG: PilZ domain-containing protein [Bacteriovoracia bacterium]
MAKSKTFFPTPRGALPAAFAPVESAMMIRKMILAAEDLGADCVVWTAGQKVVLRTRVIGQPDLYRFVALAVSDYRKVGELVKKSVAEGHCFAIIYLKDQAVVGFKTTILESDTDTLRLTLPDRVLQLQRRKDQRLRIADGYVVQVALRHPRKPAEFMRQKLLDVSVGGFSFAVTKEEVEEFFRGQFLTKVELMIRKRSVFVDVRVQSITKLPPTSRTKGMRVGVSFDQINDRDLEFLSMYIVEHTIQYQ